MYYTNTHVTVMCARIDGFSELLKKDPGEMNRVTDVFMDSMRSSVRAQRGVVIQFGSGSCIATFRSADAAFHASTALLQKLRIEENISLCIGLHCGSVVLAEGRVFGSVVHTASGLTQIACQEGFIVTACVHEELGHEYRALLGPAGCLELDNQEQEVEIFKLKRKSTALAFLNRILESLAGEVHNPEDKGRPGMAPIAMSAIAGLLSLLSQLAFHVS